MESNIERISPVECRVHVEIPWAAVGPRLEGKMRDLRNRVNLPGFRRGKVPTQMLERMYGRSVRDELARDLVQETFQTAVVQHETNPLTQPAVESMQLEQGQSFQYAARFEVAPEVAPKDYEGIEVERVKQTITDDRVMQTLEEKRLEFVEISPIQDEKRTKSQEGDVWTVDLTGSFGDSEIERKDVRIEIGGTPEFLPGMSDAMVEQLVITKIDEAQQLKFMPPQDNLKEEFKGKEVTLEVTARDVREKIMPELDDEFAKDTGQAETLEELKTAVREELLEQAQMEAERDSRRALVARILELNPFEPAPSMVGREVAAQVELFKRQVGAQGLSLAQVGTTEERLSEQMRPQAVFNVKAFLALDAIGKEHGIEVTEEELEEELKAMAEEQGQNMARLRATMERNNQLMLMRAQMREEKILDLLMQKAKVTEVDPPEPDTNDDQGEEAAAEKSADSE